MFSRHLHIFCSFIYLFHYTVYLMSIYSMCIFFSYFPFFTQDRIKDFLDSLLSSISVLSSPFNYSNFPLLIIYKKICCVFVLYRYWRWFINRNRFNNRWFVSNIIDWFCIIPTIPQIILEFWCKIVNYISLDCWRFSSPPQWFTLWINLSIILLNFILSCP